VRALPLEQHPPLPSGLDFTKCDGKNGNPDYLHCFGTCWQWTRSDDFKSKMTTVVRDPDFLKDNFLSTDLRIPVSLLQTNICSPLATNAIRGNIWDNFSSETYKDLPGVDAVPLSNPWTGQPYLYPGENQKLPAGGRGYTRPASLVSVWSTAPFPLNSTLGKFDPAAKDESTARLRYTPSPGVDAGSRRSTTGFARCCGRRRARRMRCSRTTALASDTSIGRRR